MNVLVDSSVWVCHFRLRNEHLVALLEADLVVCHPFIVTEVACGTPPNRKAIISMLSELECTPVPTQDKLLAMVDTQQLYGLGCGFVDLSLLASAHLSEKTRIWILEKRFEQLAVAANLAFIPQLHALPYGPVTSALTQSGQNSGSKCKLPEFTPMVLHAQNRDSGADEVLYSDACAGGHPPTRLDNMGSVYQ